MPAGDYTVIRLNANGEVAQFSFKCPHDFTTLTHCSIVGRIVGTGTIDWTVTTDFAADGEAYTINSDSDTEDGLVVTDDELKTIDLSAALTGLAANDHVGLKFSTDIFTDSFRYEVLHLVFKYS